MLKWESQRSDTSGRLIAQIVSHVQAGCEVVVAVRSGPGDDFEILGRTRDVRLNTNAEFLPQQGDHLVGERGSTRVHRHVTAQCLDVGLKNGTGLMAYRYPLADRAWKPRYCLACCWRPATAVLTFETLGEKACEILQASDAPTADPEKMNLRRPRTRLYGKQALKHGSRDDACREHKDIDRGPVATARRAIAKRKRDSFTARMCKRWPAGVLGEPRNSAGELGACPENPRSCKVEGSSVANAEATVGGIKTECSAPEPSHALPIDTTSSRSAAEVSRKGRHEVASVGQDKLRRERHELLTRLIELNVELDGS
eukprot:TRINITY_DN17412_c0_g1_i2.p1 TRINITY_DN17412_c0_g1~~TRINITY_DN17412_c0_g1_i2.p1  ORF type:complete len:313 (+),score=41.22 TRINITY_DN17412_c0_g1_i2:524-1462(+)